LNYDSIYFNLLTSKYFNQNNRVVLQIEHAVPDFEGWKKAFEQRSLLIVSNPGVRRYRIFRQAHNPNYVITELDFDSLGEAEAMLVGLQKLWKRVEGKVMMGTKARIVEPVESREY
jgi:hypothetical protein